jgi:hypothetical protein
MLARLMAVGVTVVLWSSASGGWAQKVVVNIWDGAERSVMSQLYPQLPV